MSFCDCIVSDYDLAKIILEYRVFNEIGCDIVIGWELLDTLETAPMLTAVQKTIIIYGKPGIINSGQSCQFTSEDYIGLLKRHGIRRGMDGKTRWVDNVIIERWFRSLKTENIYINEYATPRALRARIGAYIDEYNNGRLHETFNLWLQNPGKHLRPSLRRRRKFLKFRLHRYHLRLG